MENNLSNQRKDSPVDINTKNPIMSEFLSVFGLLSTNQVVSTLTGVVRTKLLAVLVGLEGIGIYSLARSLLEMLKQVNTFGLSGGYVSLIAECSGADEPVRLNRLISSALWLFGIISLLSVLVINLFASFISQWIFGAIEYVFAIRIVSISAFIYVEYSIVLSTFQGLLKWKEYSRIVNLVYLIAVFIIAPLTYFYELQGAIASILVTQLVGFAIAAYILINSKYGSNNIKLLFEIDSKTVRGIFRYLGSLTIYVLILSIGPVIIRKMIAAYFGISSNGIYEVAWGISIVYMGVLNNVINNHGMPKVASVKRDYSQVLLVQNNGLKLAILIVIPTAVLLYLSSEYWISVLYSREFLTASSLLLWQFLGDIFRILRIGLNITLIPFEKLRFLVFQELLMWVSWILLFVYQSEYFYLEAITISYCVANFVGLIVSYLHQKRMGFMITPENTLLLAKSSAYLVTFILLRQLSERPVITIALCLIAVVTYFYGIVPSSDRQDLIIYLKKYAKR